MTPEMQVAQALIDLVAFFLPGFIGMIVIEWAIGFFRGQ